MLLVRLLMNLFNLNLVKPLIRVFLQKIWRESPFVHRFLSYLGLSALFILAGLLVGILGYHWGGGAELARRPGGSLNDSQRHGAY